MFLSRHYWHFHCETKSIGLVKPALTKPFVKNVTSLSQGWLINHPECRVSNFTHSAFFTACSHNEQLHNKGVEAFHNWPEFTQSAKITPRTLSDGIDVDYLCLNAIHELMKDGASRKKPSLRDIRAQKRAQSSLAELDKVTTDLETSLSNLEDPMRMVVAPPLQ
jgi:hypothetical protein